MPERKNLTKRVVDALRADPKGRDVTYFDETERGFGVRVKPSGAKSYVFKYRNRFGEQRKLTIARVGEGGFTPDDARKAAERLRGEVIAGKDPAADRKAEREAVTVAELCDEYLEAGKATIKPSTLKVDRSRIERHVKPLLGSRAVKSLTRKDMERFLADVIAGKSVRADKSAKGKRARGGVARGGAGVASRTLGMLGTILERAVPDAITVNPVRGVKRPKDNEAKPAFSFERVEAVGKAIREAVAEGENETGAWAIRALLLTGCRRMEGLTLTWGVVDEQARCFRFKDTKSGKQMRAVGRTALDLLASFKPKDASPDDYVFRGTSKAGHLVGLPKIWDRIAARAKIKGVSLHGLRHWFASAATELGYSELIIGALLGHAKRGITGRYATAPDPALLAAADRIAARLADALDGVSQGSARVVSLRGGAARQ